MRTGLFMAVLALGAGTAHADNGFIYVGAGVSKDKLSNIAPSGGLADIDKTSWKVLAGLRPVSTFRSEEHTSELQSHSDLVCRLLHEKKNKSHRNLVYRLLLEKKKSHYIHKHNII